MTKTMCDRHALVVGAIASLMGFRSQLAYGELSLIGKTQSSLALLPVSQHSWAMIEGAGFYDVSLNLVDGRGPGWKGWPHHLLIGTNFPPSNRIEFQMFGEEQKHLYSYECEKAIQRAKIDSTHYSAVYYAKSAEPLCQKFILEPGEGINSPLTDDLKKLRGFTESIYAKAIEHFWLILQRRARPLGDLLQLDAWNEISKRDEKQIVHLMNRVSIPLEPWSPDPAAK